MQTRIGIIAIGRNEGDRLRACLAAACAVADATVVYVDSNSTDNSVSLAKSLGAEVIELDMTIPFTAARARNEGFAHLMQIAPDTEFVQFLDGDCQLQDGWVELAITTLQNNPTCAIVCGRRRERHPEASIYNRLCDIEWNTPIGKAKSCGGDAMIRVRAFKQVGGYNPSVIAGEEPEMCVRLRHAGWEIHRLDAEMTLHDAAMTQFSQWWKRNYRAGHAYAEGNDRHGSPPELFRQKEVQSNRIWGWLWFIPLAWPFHALLALKIAQYMKSKRGLKCTDALFYGVSVAMSKLPMMLGQRKYYSNKSAGKQAKIIEYKGAGT